MVGYLPSFPSANNFCKDGNEKNLPLLERVILDFELCLGKIILWAFVLGGAMNWVMVLLALAETRRADYNFITSNDIHG